MRSFEHFKQLHVGMLAELKRKTLPVMAKATGESDPQALHHVVKYAPWSVEKLRERRLTKLKQALAGRVFTLCIDETGNKKKGKATDYVARQYIGNLGKLDNGIVSVNAYGVLDHLTFPLLFQVFKPQTRLKPEDIYKTKPALAVEITKELLAWGFRFDVVLAFTALPSAFPSRKLRQNRVLRPRRLNTSPSMPGGTRGIAGKIP